MKALFLHTKYRWFLCILLLSGLAKGQNTTIRGKIIDAVNGQSLPFVTVLIKNSQKGTLTDIDGKFELTLPTEDRNLILQISYISYQPKTIALSEISDPQKIVVKLKAHSFE